MTSGSGGVGSLEMARKRSLKSKISRGKLQAFGRSFSWELKKSEPASNAKDERGFLPAELPIKVHIGPGPHWTKPDSHWVNVDVDPRRADVVVDFQQFSGFPFPDESAECIYGSHVFEHMSIWVTDAIFADCCRVLRPGGVLRIVLPDVERSMREYLAGNEAFPLFARRRKRAKKKYDLEYTLFDCLREDFLSRSSQEHLLGKRSLAHQNAWDFDSLRAHLQRAGFGDVRRCSYQGSPNPLFDFEGTYPCEAQESDRSLYAEAVKSTAG